MLTSDTDEQRRSVGNKQMAEWLSSRSLQPGTLHMQAGGDRPFLLPGPPLQKGDSTPAQQVTEKAVSQTVLKLVINWSVGVSPALALDREIPSTLCHLTSPVANSTALTGTLVHPILRPSCEKAYRHGDFPGQGGRGASCPLFLGCLAGVVARVADGLRHAAIGLLRGTGGCHWALLLVDGPSARGR